MAADDPAYAALYPRVSTGRQMDNWSVKDQLSLARLGKERGPAGGALRRRPGHLRRDHRGPQGHARPDASTWRRATPARPWTWTGCPWSGAGWWPSSASTSTGCPATRTPSTGCGSRRRARTPRPSCSPPARCTTSPTRATTSWPVWRCSSPGTRSRRSSRLSPGACTRRPTTGSGREGPSPTATRLVRDVPHPDGRFRGRLVIDQDEAGVVREMYDLYVNGLTLPDGTWRPLTISAVAAVLNERGYLLPGRTRRKEQTPGPPALRGGRRPAPPLLPPLRRLPGLGRGA